MTKVSHFDQPSGEDESGGNLVFALALVVCASLVPFLLWLEDKDFSCLAVTALASVAFQVALAVVLIRLVGWGRWR